MKFNTTKCCKILWIDLYLTTQSSTVENPTTSGNPSIPWKKSKQYLPICQRKQALSCYTFHCSVHNSNIYIHHQSRVPYFSATNNASTPVTQVSWSMTWLRDNYEAFHNLGPLAILYVHLPKVSLIWNPPFPNILIWNSFKSFYFFTCSHSFHSCSFEKVNNRSKT